MDPIPLFLLIAGGLAAAVLLLGFLDWLRSWLEFRRLVADLQAQARAGIEYWREHPVDEDDPLIRPSASPSFEDDYVSEDDPDAPR